MAFKGTLADIGVVDLLQFAHAGRKTGELVIAEGQQEARLFYEKGQVVHAILGAKRGLDVLVQVVGWRVGNFEFKAGPAQEERTIQVDLPRAVMFALKARDEQQIEGAGQGERNGRVTNLLSQFVTGTKHIAYACVVQADGTVQAEAGGASDGLDTLERLRDGLRALQQGYPRQDLRRMFLLDGAGTVALTTLDQGRSLLVVAGKEVTLGALSVAVGKAESSLLEAR